MSKNQGAAQAPTHRIAIIGSGFAGLGMAIQLKKAGIDDFVVFEKEAGVGGTWRVNEYPGCACDVPSHLYSYSFEPNPDWSRMFSPQPEIKAYLERCAQKYGVVPHIRFGTEIAGMRWDETKQLWRIATRDGIQHRARVVISGMGGLSTPATPELPGIENFRGKTFHSQNWDHDYDLSDKRVAVIGTGASAIQFVPQIQPKVKRLDLYQRTPPWIVPKPDRAISMAERTIFRLAPRAQAALRNAIYWQHEARVLGFVVNPRFMVIAKRWALSHIRKQVPDRELRAKITPDYTIGCKRVLISNDYYPALSQPNVDVISHGIREVRANSILGVDGVEREVDAIIFGTGFKATDPVPPGVVFGRNGKDLVDAWPQGPEAYKGAAVSGFPNLFFLMGPNTGLGHNSMVYMIESQITYVMDALATMQRMRLSSVDVSPQAQARYNAGLQARVKDAVWNTGGCSSWYLHPVSGRNVTLWPGFTWQFRAQTKKFDVAAYRLRPVPRNADVRSPAPAGAAPATA